MENTDNTEILRETSTMYYLDALFEHLPEQLLFHPISGHLFVERFEELNILRAFLMDPHPHIPGQVVLVENGILEDALADASKLESIISSFDLNKMDIHMVEKLIKDFDHKASYDWWFSLEEIFNKWSKPSPHEYYPRTAIHGYIDHLGEYLKQVIKAKPHKFIAPLKFSILLLQPMLHLVSGLLNEIPERRKEDVDLKIIIHEVANLAYQIEYAIDLLLVTEIPIWYTLFWLQYIYKQIKPRVEHLNSQSGDIESIMRQIRDFSTRKPKIIPLLCNNDINHKLDEIFKAATKVVGFEVCTWSFVSSYKHNKEEMFLQLLHNASITKFTDKIKYKFLSNMVSSSENDKLKRKIQLLLEEKYCFIMLKDVNDIEDFDEIRRFIRNNSGISKILVTTRSPELVAYCHNRCQKDLSYTIMSGNETSTLQQYTKSTLEGDVVGFNTETIQMLESLTGESKQLRIISISGMAGQGKTTFAKKLYNRSAIASYFDRRAWCCVSQAHEKKELILELLGQVVQLSDTIRQSSDHDLTEMLWRSLKGHRFLIVLDDIWDIEAWNDLCKCFPNDKNGSRIIFTTRLLDLGSQAQSDSVLQTLDGLSDDESWTLLQKKVFQNKEESCPPQLLEIGMEIAKYCKGLPLSIVLTAGLLVKTEKRKDLWEAIAKSLSSLILGDADAEKKGVIGLSYEHLPDLIKPCFLYFGVFAEDREIPVKKLIRLWIAEGFIKHSITMSLEEVADDYLKDLIGRSLVTIAREKSKGGVKSCRVHDLIREFALIKATEENFFQQIQRYDEQLDSISGPITFDRRRLCISSNNNHFFNLRAKPIGPYVRSLQVIGSSDMSPSYSYDVSFIFQNFKLLRIVNFEDINVGNSLKEIDVLIHLRYLAVQCTTVSVPSSIANILNLETFCVKSLEDKVVEVPDSIWTMEQLRHVQINDRASFHMNLDIPEDSYVLDNLQTLSTPSLAYGDDMEKMLRKLRGIRKLKCNFIDSTKDATKFPLLGFLDKLESLKVFYSGTKNYPCEFNFPLNLNKLTLTNFHMPWKEISQLVKLHSLEVLKLQGNAFEGETWEMEDEIVFPNLKFLKLDTLNVIEWIATNDNFPYLEHLLLHKCEKLKEIPSAIGDIDTLLMIQVKWCSPSAASWARTIMEEKLMYGNKDFKIDVRDAEPSP